MLRLALQVDTVRLDEAPPNVSLTNTQQMKFQALLFFFMATLCNFKLHLNDKSLSLLAPGMFLTYIISLNIL